MRVFPAMGDIGIEEQAVTNREQVSYFSNDAGNAALDQINEFAPGMADILNDGLMRIQSYQDWFGPQWRQTISQILDHPIGKAGDCALPVLLIYHTLFC